MKKETFIQKWLDGELSPAELDAFKKTEAYHDYAKLAETARLFQADNFDTEKNYESVRTRIKRQQKEERISVFLKIAAVFVIAFASYFTIFHSNETEIKSLAGQTEKTILPDGSVVLLNAVSELTYEENAWKENREVHLQGEAFFKVEKGSRFSVITSTGTISVLGTHFNIKERENYFEVTCFEGLVSVKTSKDSILLPAGKTFRLVNGLTQHSKTDRSKPSWTSDLSSFQSVPFKEVVAEFERQYKVEVRLKTRTFDANQLFTGSFVHNDMEMALKSISIPFNLRYTRNDDMVILKVGD
ncbi:MAG TPA: FecR family protein [Flavobacteriaceae bacterium]|nr:FecR family protein [Flavobacteriaceae bacterium]